MKTTEIVNNHPKTIALATITAGFFLIGMLFSSATAIAESLSVQAPKTEYRENPVGIDVMEPRFSWIIQSNRRITHQRAFRLQVSSGNTDFDSRQHLVWDTGRIISGQSVHNVYKGPEPKPGIRYHWRVKVWDNHGRESDWSEAAYWETGLLGEENWHAKWIEPDIGEDVESSPPAPILRREFSLNGDIAHARAYVTSHGVYEMEINGSRAGDQVLSPGWTSYHNRLQYQTYDITGLLHSGENAMGVMLGDGWFRGYIGWGDQRNFYGSKLALLLQLEITYSDGRSEVIISDENWKSSTGAIIRSDIYNGEYYDARKEIPGWSQSGFDDMEWSGVRITDHGNSHLIGQQVQPVKKIQELKPQKIFVTPEGDTVLDMGQNMIGWIRLKVEGERGTKITLRHAEVLDKDGNFYTENLRSADQMNTYILKGEGVEVWEPRFTFQGFQYVAINGYPGELTKNAITGIVLHSDIEPTGHFQSSNALINQLQHNIVWGQKGNFLDIPTDCPQRDERMGWTGDIQVFAETAHINMNTNAFLTKWLADVEADQLDNGSIPHVIPNVLRQTDNGASGWADAGVIVPWSVYQFFGDTRILETQYHSMKAWVDYMDNRAAETDNRYLWDGDFTFGDWLSFNTTRSDYPGAFTDKDLISTAFFAWSSKLLSKTARTLGKSDDYQHYAQLYDYIKEAFQQEFITPNGRLMSNTQTSYLLALRFGLVPEDLIPEAVNHLVGRIRSMGHLTTGFLGTPHLNPILSEYGHADIAYDLLLRERYPSWLYPVTMGATTIWERWDGIRPDGSFQNPGMNSFNHYAYGAIGEWLFKEVAGIRAASPAYREIQIKPVPGGNLNHARALVQSVHGRIESSWHIDKDGFHLTVEIPANSSATIHLPYAVQNEVLESGKPLREADGIHHIVTEADGVAVEVGSGRYNFFSSYSDPDSGLNQNDNEIDGESDKGLGPDAKIALILTDSTARNILEKHMPELMQSAWLSQVMGFSIEFGISALPKKYRLTDEELQKLYHDLSAFHNTVPRND